MPSVEVVEGLSARAMYLPGSDKIVVNKSWADRMAGADYLESLCSLSLVLLHERQHRENGRGALPMEGTTAGRAHAAFQNNAFLWRVCSRTPIEQNLNYFFDWLSTASVAVLHLKQAEAAKYAAKIINDYTVWWDDVTDESSWAHEFYNRSIKGQAHREAVWDEGPGGGAGVRRKHPLRRVPRAETLFQKNLGPPKARTQTDRDEGPSPRAWRAEHDLFVATMPWQVLERHLPYPEQDK